jgi:hypothetical protein
MRLMSKVSRLGSLRIMRPRPVVDIEIRSILDRNLKPGTAAIAAACPGKRSARPIRLCSHGHLNKSSLGV